MKEKKENKEEKIEIIEDKVKKTDDKDKFVVKYNGLDIWTIDLKDEGVIKILPNQEIELDTGNKKQLHIILSVIKQINKPSNEISIVEKTADGNKRIKYLNKFEIVHKGNVPIELLKLSYGINKLYSPAEKEMIIGLCKDYFEDIKVK